MTCRPSKSPTLEAMKAERGEQAICVCCDGPLPPRSSKSTRRHLPSKRVTCGDPECKRLYLEIYQRDRHVRDWREKKARRAA